MCSGWRALLHVNFPAPRLAAAGLFAVLAVLALPAAPELAVSIGSIESPGFQLADLRLQVEDSKATLSAARLEVAGRRFSDVRVACGRFSWQSDGFTCGNGHLSVAGFKQSLPFSLTQRSGVLEAWFQPGDSGQWHLVRKADESVELTVLDGHIEHVQGFLPLPPDWGIGGRLDARVLMTPTAISGQVALSEGRFADKAGTHAAEKLAFKLDLEASLVRSDWVWKGELDWLGGEAYWQPFYGKGHGQKLKAHGRLDGKGRIEVTDARLHVPQIGDLAGGMQWDGKTGKVLSARLESAGLDLARSGELYLNPILTPFGVPEMSYAGHLSFRLAWDRQGLSAVTVGLNDVALQEVRGRFAASGIRGSVPWQRETKAESTIAVAQAQAGAFNFGAFELPLQIEPRRFSVRKAEIPFLDSKLVIERLVWRKSTKRQAWEGDLALSILPVRLADLTAAFGLPRMSGTLSGSFPHLRYREQAAYLDGSLVIQVFEGRLNCTHLRLEDPFGTVPRLTADIEAQRINLGQMTEAFSFGSITGYADAEIKGLELVSWKPVQFDAKIISSEGTYRKRISQRAVQNISSLGGAGAGAALQASFLRFFGEFGYDKIGITCRMRHGVCEMGGVEDVSSGYLLVKGGGLPAISVIGYNRSVDWAELVERLQAAARSNLKPVVQ